MAYSAAAVASTVAYVKKSTGADVAYSGGSWQVRGRGGAMTPAPAKYQKVLDSIAAQKDDTSPLKGLSPNAADDADDDDLFSGPVLPALRAVVPGQYRALLRRTVQGVRAAQASGSVTTGAAIVAGGAGGYALGSAVGGTRGGIGGSIGGAIGGAFGLAGGAVGAGIGTAAGMAVGGVFDSGVGAIHSGMESGRQIVTSVAAAISGGTGAVYDAATGLVHIIASVLAKPFGASGGAIAGLAGSVFGAGGGILKSGMSGATGLLGGVGSLIGGAGVVAGGLGGMVFGAAGGAINGLVGGVLGVVVTSMIGKLVGGIADLGGKLVSTFGEIFGKVVEVGGKAFEALASVIEDTVKTAMSLARNVAGLRSTTGYDYGTAQGMVNRFGAFGLSPSHADPFMQGISGAMFGLPGQNDPNYLVRFASQFQGMMRGGAVGRMMARSMADSQGMGDEDSLRFAMLPTGKIAGQLAFQNQLQGSLGIGPDQIKAFAEDMPLLTGRVSMFADAVRTKFVGEMLPSLMNGLSTATNFVIAHAGDIKNWIIKGVSWLVNDMPVMVLTGFAKVLAGASWLMGKMEDAAGYLAKHAKEILTAFDLVGNAFRDLLGILVAAAAIAKDPYGDHPGQDAKRKLFAALPKMHTATDENVKGLSDFLGARSDDFKDYKSYLDDLHSGVSGKADDLKQNGLFGNAGVAALQENTDELRAIRKILEARGGVVDPHAVIDHLATAIGMRKAQAIANGG